MKLMALIVALAVGLSISNLASARQRDNPNFHYEGTTKSTSTTKTTTTPSTSNKSHKKSN